MNGLARKGLAFMVPVLVAALLVAQTTPVAAAGNITLYLVNNAAAPPSTVFSATPPCPPGLIKHLGLSGSPGTSQDTFIPDPAAFHSMGSQGAITIPAGRNVIVKAWASSGSGLCPGQTTDQTLFWTLTFGAVPIATGSFAVPAGTTTPELFNSHGTTLVTIVIPAGGDLVLTFFCPDFPQLFYNDPNGVGRSNVKIPTT